MKAVEIVERAIRDHATIKAALASLRQRPTDDEAVAVLLRAYHGGRAPAWLTAALLGALRAENAYDLVHEMLRCQHGFMIEAYAAGAMFEIRGDRAEHDLLELAWHAPDGRTRDAAALVLSGRLTRASVLALARGKRILYGTAASLLTREGVDEALLHELLSSDAEIDLRLGTECLLRWIGDETSRARLSAIRERIEPTLRCVLALPHFRMAPSKRRELVAWQARCASEWA